MLLGRLEAGCRANDQGADSTANVLNLCDLDG